MYKIEILGVSKSFLTTFNKFFCVIYSNNFSRITYYMCYVF